MRVATLGHGSRDYTPHCTLNVGDERLRTCAADGADVRLNARMCAAVRPNAQMCALCAGSHVYE